MTPRSRGRKRPLQLRGGKRPKVALRTLVPIPLYRPSRRQPLATQCFISRQILMISNRIRRYLWLPGSTPLSTSHQSRQSHLLIFFTNRLLTRPRTRSSLVTLPLQAHPCRLVPISSTSQPIILRQVPRCTCSTIRFQKSRHRTWSHCIQSPHSPCSHAILFTRLRAY